MGHLELTSGLILYLILPTLIYDAAINIDIKALRKNIIPILLLAVFGLLISAGVIGSTLAKFTILSIGSAFVFGALISATDPVAVIGLFNEIGAPKRLVTIVDGESIFNDATAIVLFTIVMAMIKNGVTTVGSLLGHATVSFFLVLLGGLLIGGIVGLTGSIIARLQKNNLILQITLSLIMAYVSFGIADIFHVSGVMSTLAAGLVSAYMTDDSIKLENHHYIESFWNYFSFIANSFVFLLLGITEVHTFSNIQLLKQSIVPVLLAIIAVTIGRMLVVYLLIPLYNKFSKSDNISFAFQHILFWGGLRGAVPVALVLAIPHDFEYRNIIVHMTFAYILFTLLIQGTTMTWLMDKLGIKPEKTYFDYHKGVTFNLKLPSFELATLLITQLYTMMEKEGFYSIEHEEDEYKSSYLMRRGQKYMLITIDNKELAITTEENDLSYGKQLVYETLLELDNSVSSIREVARPEKMREIVREVSEDNKLTFNIVKYLHKDLIELHLKSDNKNDILKELVDIADRSNYIEDKNKVLEAVMAREKSMSTGLVKGIATPHAKSDTIKKIVLVIGIKKEGIDFESLDGQPTKLFFLIISPQSEAGPHIQLLAEIAKLSSDNERITQILNAPSPEAVINIIRKK